MAHLPPYIGKLTLALLAVGTTVVTIACSDPPPVEQPPESAVAPCWRQTSDTEPSASPPSFPYIFSGRISVGSAPAPDGLYVVACLGDAGTGAYASVPTQSGMYADVVIGTVYDDEIGATITFLLAESPGGDCLRDNSGECLKARQTYEFNYTPNFNGVSLDLDFVTIKVEG